MSRIRTIKPEFWVSEQIAECSTIARLTFVGLWNFCDDNGVHPAKPKTLKAELYPLDDFTSDEVGRWVGELIAAGLVVEFQNEGERYWHVTGWSRHQKIDRPSFKYPHPPDQNSQSARRTLGEDSSNTRRAPPPGMEWSRVEGKGVEGSRVEGKREEPSPNGEGGARRLSDTPQSVQTSIVPEPEPARGVPGCPHGKILALWAEVLPALPQHKPELWRGARADHLRARWRETAASKAWPDAEAGLTYFRRLFGYVGQSAFLTGRAKPAEQGRPPFVIELAWLVEPTNWAKVIEGKFHQDAA